MNSLLEEVSTQSGTEKDELNKTITEQNEKYQKMVEGKFRKLSFDMLNYRSTSFESD